MMTYNINAHRTSGSTQLLNSNTPNNIVTFVSTVEGLTTAKIAKFGAAFVSHIRHYCTSHGLPCDPKVSTQRQDTEL